jgi:PAS domain S-box-containing protein
VYGANGTDPVDFSLDYLNPAGQRMTGLPERPGGTLLTRFPHTVAAGIFAYYQRAFASGELLTYQANYQAEGLDNFFEFSARRSGECLLVSFSDTANQPRTAVEVALRETQAAENAARAEAEQQRHRFHEVLVQLPAYVATYHGPDHVYRFVNPPYQGLFPHRTFVGRPFREGTPEAVELGVVALFDRVYQTGEPYYAHEMEGWFDFRGTGEPEQVFLNLSLHPLRNGQGEVDGVLDFSYDVTEQVRARQQQQQLNQELETRVATRTREVEEQRNRLERLINQAPAQINIFTGPDHLWTLVHPRTREVLPNRPLLGLPRRQALSELPEEQHAPLDHVYQTGEPVHLVESIRRLDRCNDGELHDEYFDFTYQPLFDATGQIEGVMSFAVDVTERVRAREQANTLQAEVLAAAQRQGQERALVFQIFEQTPASIALLRGPEHRFEYVNQAYQELFPGRELVGHPLAEVLPDVAEQGFVALLDGVYHSGETFFGNEVPLAIAQPDGRPPRQAYFTFTYQAYYEQGQVVGVSIFAFDVAEKVQARQQREAERQQLHKLFMEAPAPIVILDGSELVYQLVNPAYQRIFPGRDLVNKPLLTALPELADTAIPPILQRVYDTGEPYVAQEVPLRLARHEGGPLEEIYWTFTYQARRNAQGTVDGVLVFAHEVTDQVQARRVVEARETSFRQLADNVPGTLWVTNPAGECTYLNARWYATTGQTQAEGLGLGWTNAVHPGDAAGAGAAFMAASARHEPFSYLFRLRQRDGAYRWVTDQGLPRFGANGEFEGMVGTVVDVHEQKLAELALQRLTAELRTSRDDAQAMSAELADSNDQLTRTNVDLDNFIYTASHDLKAPISNIEGLLYLLQEELPAAATQQEVVGSTLRRMLDSVERFKRTIDHLTEVSKLQKEHTPTAAPVNLAAVVEDVRQDLVPLVEAAAAKLMVDVAALPPIQFSEKNLRSIVYNLLSNAVKYRSPARPPRVDVRGHVRAGHTVLEVHDNGLGIAEHQLPKLFTMFQRFHDHVEGTGIGLYMVKRMVENAGGRIEVHSQLGAGTTFFVYLPQAPAPGA